MKLTDFRNTVEGKNDYVEHKICGGAVKGILLGTPVVLLTQNLFPDYPIVYQTVFVISALWGAFREGDKAMKELYPQK